MKLEFENEEVIALAEIVDEVYSGLLFERQMHKIGKKIGMPEEVLRDKLYLSAKILLNLSKEAHYAGLCGCEDDLNLERQEKIFNHTFKKEIATNQWWKEQALSRGQFLVASPQSPTFFLKTGSGKATHEREQDKPQA